MNGQAFDSNHSSTNSVPPLVKDLAEGYSRNIRSAARIWLAIITVSVVVFIRSDRANRADRLNAHETRPAESQPSMTEALRDLPFGLGETDLPTFYKFCFLLMTVLLVGFGAAHVQAGRTRALADRILKAMPSQRLLGDVDVQDVFDAIVASGPNRVAPLAQVVRGKWIFRAEKSACPRWLSRLSFIYYLVLKVIALAFYVLLPAFGARVAFTRWADAEVARGGAHVVEWWVTVLWVTAGAAVLEMVVMEFIFFGRAGRGFFGVRPGTQTAQAGMK